MPSLSFIISQSKSLYEPKRKYSRAMVGQTWLIHYRPSLELLKQQTTYTPAVQDGGLNPAMTVTQGTSNYQELIGMFQQRMETGSSGPQWERNDSKVIISWKTIGDMVYLRNLTELSYQLPSNTTLVEVLGPVGRNNMTSYGSQ